MTTIQVVTNAEIIRLLKAKVAEIGGSQNQTAAALGIKQSLVSNVLRGHHRATRKVLAALGLKAKRAVFVKQPLKHTTK
ncbi:helix-turn-helix transcriptional regulator [Mesorhizobium sp.]|uniref:helix-turn-helix domain-containing protein n=1 Tax=Mesorhizobium sp. TaxID=1871066 RepID=UPI000FE43722|nr:helix-turn-helix transcriptional regulator [Mesorhizobium sp.]RWH75384.1 MAG: XRE family transcriptional regulator [Mesorhizobium sp.]RWL19836.1 MAG: XRE family transcriptional regulator [Mesorhizobium sp.]RWL27147.1 MAG: XRE family transcriptional regulator [Mesorhizobium sp.]RWL33558.1 MAG: XRE family transcriptional regulator [Mesorhizobium sp.]RWL42357.1 MAG: XRE family transcriptional regulator [Mesorhizobium sp.]